MRRRVLEGIVYRLCMQLLDLSIVVMFEVVLELPKEVTTEDVGQTMVSAVSVE